MLGVVVLERMLGLFLLAQIVHIAWWRWRRPSAYLFWFLEIWLIVPAFFIALWLGIRAVQAEGIDWNDALAWFGAFVGHGALCGAYVMVYPAISELSPSLELLWAILRAPDKALPIASIEIPTVGGVQSVAHRVANLQSSGLAVMEEGILMVSPSGRRIASAIETYRRLLGIKYRAGG
jgi:hypothetical protein